MQDNYLRRIYCHDVVPLAANKDCEADEGEMEIRALLPLKNMRASAASCTDADALSELMWYKDPQVKKHVDASLQDGGMKLSTRCALSNLQLLSAEYL